MAIDIKGLLSNPMAAYKSASQPGGLLAPVTSMNQFLGDPRVHAGLAIARGESVGDALVNSANIQSSFAPAERKIIKGADGFNYYEDGTRVLPGIKGKESEEYKSAKAKDGFLRYTEGPDKGKKVFPDIAEDAGVLFDNESKLRTDFQTQSKEFKEVNAAYGRILSNDPTPAGDISLIFQYMKMLDPRSTVREGEFATVQNAGSIPEVIRAKYNGVKEGTKLTEGMRADYLQQAENLYDTALENQSYIENEYTSFSEQYGFDPKRVVIEYGKPLEKQRYTKKISVMSNTELGQLNAVNLTEMQKELLYKELIKRGKTK